jgi:hypothetical protein
MRGPQVTLPEAAANKLSELQLQRDSSLDLMRATQNRIGMLPASNVKLRDRLVTERDKCAERHRVLALLVNKLNEWHMSLRLPPGSILESATASDIKIKASESLTEAVASVRREGFEVIQQINKVRAAPLKKQSQQEAVRSYLIGLARRVGPKVSFDVRGNARIAWSEDLVTGKDDLLGVLAWLFGPQPIATAFERDLDQPEAPNAVTPLEREQKISKLTNDLLALERKEEYLIEKAASEGAEILRRPDCSPLAVLNLAIMQQQVQAVA